MSPRLSSEKPHWVLSSRTSPVIKSAATHGRSRNICLAWQGLEMVFTQPGWCSMLIMLSYESSYLTLKGVIMGMVGWWYQKPANTGFWKDNACSPVFLLSSQAQRFTEKSMPGMPKRKNKHLFPKYWALEMNPRSGTGEGTCLRCSMLSPPLAVGKS